MVDYFSILDNIKKKYIQIDKVKYEKIVTFISFMWNCVKELLKIKNNKEKNYDLQIKEYLSFFDPKKVPATRLKIVNKLPSRNMILSKNLIEEKEIEELNRYKIIDIIKRVNKYYLIITPEGLIFYFALLESKNYDDIYRLNTLILQKYEKLLLNKFREFIFQKISFIQTKEDKITLNNLDIGILLFFLVNGSIDQEKAFIRESMDLERALNTIVYSFYKNKEFSEEERTDIKIRVLQSDLSLLQSKIGYIIHSEKKVFFLKSEDLTFIFNVLKEGIKEKNKDDIISRWNFFLNEYNHWRPILRQSNMCFYDRFEVKKIEEEILNIKN